MKKVLPYSFNSENNKEKHRQKNWLNLDEKFITTFLLILKMTVSNAENKTGFT